MDINWTVIFTALQIILAAFVAITTWKVTQRKNTIEYFQAVSEDLKKRVTALEGEIKRLRSANQFLRKHVKPEIAAVASDIESGIWIRKDDDDVTESHS